MSRKQKISPEEKVKLVRRFLSGEISVYEAAQVAGVGKTSIYNWIDVYETEGEAGFLPWEGNRLHDTETKLQAVLEYLEGKGSYRDISKNTNSVHKRSLESG